MSELRGDLCIVHNVKTWSIPIIVSIITSKCLFGKLQALQKIHEQDDTVNVDQLASMLNKDMPL